MDVAIGCIWWSQSHIVWTCLSVLTTKTIHTLFNTYYRINIIIYVYMYISMHTRFQIVATHCNKTCVTIRFMLHIIKHCRWWNDDPKTATPRTMDPLPFSIRNRKSLSQPTHLTRLRLAPFPLNITEPNSPLEPNLWDVRMRYNSGSQSRREGQEETTAQKVLEQIHSLLTSHLQSS